MIFNAYVDLYSFILCFTVFLLVFLAIRSIFFVRCHDNIIKHMCVKYYARLCVNVYPSPLNDNRMHT